MPVDLFVNGRKMPCTTGPDLTVNDILEPIRRDNTAGANAILELVCDGITVGDDNIIEVLTASVSNFERVELRTGSPVDMVATALHQAAEELQAADVVRLEAIKLFGSGDVAEGVQVLGKCLGSWHQINETIGRSLELLGTTNENLREESQRLAAMLGPVVEQLGEVKSALQTGDYVTVSDVLEYEFSEVTRCWRRCIDVLLSLVAAPAA
jgi:hypothetical protein